MLVAVVVAVTVLGAGPAKLPLRMTAEVIEQDETGTWVLARIENTGHATLLIVPPVYRSASGKLWGAAHGDFTVTFQTATVDADGVCAENVAVKAKVTRAGARTRRTLPPRRITAETSSLREGQCAYVKRLLRNDTPEVRFYSGPLEANDESPRCHRYGRIGLEPGASVEVWSADDGMELVHWPVTDCLRPERLRAAGRPAHTAAARHEGAPPRKPGQFSTRWLTSTNGRKNGSATPGIARDVRAAARLSEHDEQ